jgi:hypothetical protein
VSQNPLQRCSSSVDERSEAVVEMKPGGTRFDLETIFHAQYKRIARVIACVIRDPARAEDSPWRCS